jgi:hypothetical protein
MKKLSNVINRFIEGFLEICNSFKWKAKEEMIGHL